MKWTIRQHFYGVVITSPDGKLVCLQGDEANELVDTLAECETDEQEQLILDAYCDVVE